jgi:hypothetical protein
MSGDKLRNCPCCLLQPASQLMSRFRYLAAAALALVFVHSTACGQFLGPQSLSQSSYVIDKDGNLWTWGWNATGQLGIGNVVDQPKPVMVAKPSGVTAWTLVAGGAKHALAVADSTKLYAWGFNGDGELGDGTVADQNIPKLIQNPAGVTGWKWVTAGADHPLALATNGQLYAWGSNAFGQLGLPADSALHTKPVNIPHPIGYRRRTLEFCTRRKHPIWSCDRFCCKWGITHAHFDRRRKYIIRRQQHLWTVGPWCR